MAYSKTFHENFRAGLVGNDLTVISTKTRPTVTQLRVTPKGGKRKVRIGVRGLKVNVEVRHNTRRGYRYYTITTIVPRRVDVAAAQQMARGLAERSRRYYFPDQSLTPALA